MRMSIPTKALFFVCACALFLGCRKDEQNDPAANPSGPSSTLRDLFAQNVSDATQTFSFSATAGGHVTGDHGTRVFFSAGAFLDQAGLPVTGMIQIHLVEVLTVGDMVWLNKQTMGDNGGTLELLTSGGELLVTATQGADTLATVPNGMTVFVPTDVPDPNMALFSGQEDADGRMIWEQVDTTSLSTIPDSSGVGAYYVLPYTLSSTTLNWINCDYFGSDPVTPFTATPPAGHPLDSTVTWVVFPSVNGVSQLHYTGSNTLVFGSWGPIGYSAVVVSLYRNGSQYYSSFVPVTMSVGLDVPLNYSPTTLNQFEAVVGGL